MTTPVSDTPLSGRKFQPLEFPSWLRWGQRKGAFVDNVARRNGGRVLQAAPERLGEYVIRDFLRTRSSGRR